jgi:glyoxalase family protein
MSDTIDGNNGILGIHHITLVCENASRTARFYVETLGLQFVKKTVNFDRPSTYHLYFGNDIGSPGTLVTFFEWPDAAPGRLGAGTTHHLALTVDSVDALLKWKARLQHLRRVVAGPHDNGAYASLIFTDPDGVILEVTTAGPGLASDAPQSDLRKWLDQTWPEPVSAITPDMAIRGIHHVSPISGDMERTATFYTGVLGIPCVSTMETHEGVRRSFFSPRGGAPGTLITYEEMPRDTPIPRGSIGHGVTHHVAFEVGSNTAQEWWREHLLAQGLIVTPVIDRKYFRSIYFEDPDGLILEIATSGPGFLVDQSPDELGVALALPEWLESQRRRIESDLEPIDLA